MKVKGIIASNLVCRHCPLVRSLIPVCYVYRCTKVRYLAVSLSTVCYVYRCTKVWYLAVSLSTVCYVYRCTKVQYLAVSLSFTLLLMQWNCSHHMWWAFQEDQHVIWGWCGELKYVYCDIRSISPPRSNPPPPPPRKPDSLTPFSDFLKIVNFPYFQCLGYKISVFQQILGQKDMKPAFVTGKKTIANVLSKWTAGKTEELASMKYVLCSWQLALNIPAKTGTLLASCYPLLWDWMLWKGAVDWFVVHFWVLGFCRTWILSSLIGISTYPKWNHASM